MAAFGAHTLCYFYNIIEDIYYDLDFYSIGIFLNFAVSAAMLVLLFLSIAKKQIISKLWFIPGILQIVFYLYFVYYVYSLLLLVVSLVLTLFETVAFFLVGRWLCYYDEGPADDAPAMDSETPFASDYSPVANTASFAYYGDGYRRMVVHILLLVFTFGIYGFIWIYKATAYLNQSPVGEKVNPTAELICCIFVPFYQIYWFYKHAQKVDGLAKACSAAGNDVTTLCLVFGIFFPLISFILVQDKINQIALAKPAE